MPIYKYQCTACGHCQEALQKMSDEPLTECDVCGKPALKKSITAASFRLSGSGWYETDFKSDNRRNIAAKDSSEPAAEKKSSQDAASDSAGKQSSQGAASDSAGKQSSQGAASDSAGKQSSQGAASDRAGKPSQTSESKSAGSGQPASKSRAAMPAQAKRQ